jgi:phosphotransferase system enzyme I (PtsI)
MTDESKKERAFHGIGVSPGVAHGTIYVYRIAEAVVPEYDITPDQIPQEIARFEQALIKTREQLHALQHRIAAGVGASAPSAILDAHLLFTEDPTLIDPVIQRLETEHKNVEYLFHEVAQKYIQTLSEIPDEFLRERIVDVKDVVRRILHNLLGKEARGLQHLPPNTIVVAYDLAPSDTSTLDRANTIGFATDVGSHTSHTAIMARSMNIPAVVGLHDASQHVHDGQIALLDGYSGLLIIDPSEQTLDTYGRLQLKRKSVQERLAALRALPAETTDGHRITLSGNIEMPQDVPIVIENGGEGIGLFRTEFLYLNRKDLPTEQEQFEIYRQVAQQVKPHTVIIRTVDLGGDKFHSEEITPTEINPFLGWRAIRFCLERLDVFKAQLRAILRASTEGNVKLMFPMISSVDELVRANEIVEQVKAELRAENQPFDEKMEVGAMIEVPSAALTADLLAGEVDFFSIGTNDLIQYSLAVDRVNEKIAHLYEPTHPAILKLIQQTIAAARANNIWVGVCGQMASEPLYVPLLVGMGVDELSVSGNAVPRVKDVIRRLSLAEAKKFAAAAFQCGDPKKIRACAEELVRRLDPELLGLNSVG